MTTIVLIALTAWVLLSVPLALVVGRAFAQTSIAFGDHHSQTDLAFIGTRADLAAKPTTEADLPEADGPGLLAS